MQKKFIFDYLPPVLHQERPVRASFLPHVTRAARALDSVFTEKSRELGIGLTHDQFMLLVGVREHPAATQQDLAASLCRERTAITHALHALEREGWLEKHPSSQDKRKTIYVPTQKTMNAWDALSAAAWTTSGRGESNISEEEMIQCMNTLVKVFCNLSPGQNIYRLHDEGE